MNGSSITDAFPPMEIDALCWYVKNFFSLPFPQQAKFVHSLVDIHPILSIDWLGQDLSRVRALSPTDTISSVADVIWPETPNPKGGRLHVEGHPVVYLATNKDTALRETRVEDGYVALAKFSKAPSASVSLCPIGEIALIMRQGRGHVINQEIANEFMSLLNNCPHDQLRAIAIADAFLCELLTDRSADYRLTSLVPQAIFQKNEHIDAFLYPSQVQMAGVNIAIRRDRFWNKWGVSSVIRTKAVHLASGFYKLTEISQVDGIFNTGVFRWAKDLSKDESCLLLSPPWQPNSTL